MRRSDLSAPDLAKKAGVPTKLINSILNDKTGYPDEETTASVAGALRNGSSPRARGTHQFRGFDRNYGRFIPACAGNTQRSADRSRSRAVHPRVRGEH